MKWMEMEKKVPEKSEISEVAGAKPDDADADAADVVAAIENKDHEEPIVEFEATNMESNANVSPLDLGHVSQDIDRFIFALSLSKDNHNESHLELLEQFALLVEATLAKYDSNDSLPLIADEDSSSFLQSLDRISKLLASLCQFDEQMYAQSINRITAVHQRAMSFLEEEFRCILEDYKVPESEDVDDSSSSSSKAKHDHDADQNSTPKSDHSSPAANNFPGYSTEMVVSLRTLAQALVSGGYEIECCQVYFIARRNASEEILNRLGFDKYSIDDLQKMHWESLEREIVVWIKTFKQCATDYLSSERKLSDTVFSASISGNLFGSLGRGIIIQLLNFAEAVAMTKRSAEKLFKYLDIYEALRDLIPSIGDLFPTEELLSEASLTKARVGEAMICIFHELENSIKCDAGKTPVPGGAVHPLTRYTLNYIRYACEYKDTLERVFREHQKIERADSARRSDYDYEQQQNNENQREDQSPFKMQLIKVMDLLDENLEMKSKLYKDTSLSLIFLMNNGRYILQKLRGSTEINSLMGDPWCRKRSSDLRQYHKNYQRETWGKLLNCLSHEGLNVNGKVVKPVLKERFKNFNAMFDEIHRAQCTWLVSDEQLQSELRVSISAVVIPAYRSFLARFSQYFTPGRQTEKYVKFQPEDLETYIDELFDGNTTPMGRRKL